MRISSFYTTHGSKIIASPASYKNISLSRFFTFNSIRYGRSAIGARVSVRSRLYVPVNYSNTICLYPFIKNIPVFDSSMVRNSSCVTKHTSQGKKRSLGMSFIRSFLFPISLLLFLHFNLIHIRQLRFNSFIPPLLKSEFVTVPEVDHKEDSFEEKTSFYEQCIIEINKIAILGRRVFRNATSSKISKYYVGGNITFIDDISESTRQLFRRRIRRRRIFKVLRYRRKINKISRGRYLFSRLSYRGITRLFNFFNGKFEYKRSVSSYASAHTHRLRHSILCFLHSIVLREKLELRKRAEYPFNIWSRKQGINIRANHGDTYCEHKWEQFLAAKVRNAFNRNIGTFLYKNVPKIRSIEHYPRRSRLQNTFLHKISVNTLSKFDALYKSEPTFFMNSLHSISSLLFACKGGSLSEILLYQVITMATRLETERTSLYNSLLRYAYQIIEKIDMSISSVHSNECYLQVCKGLFSSVFLLYYRPYVYDVLNRALLRVPSKVGGDALDRLPEIYKDELIKKAYSTSKLSRYKKKLIKSGVLKMPTFSILDGLFSCYYSSDWRAQARAKALKFPSLITGSSCFLQSSSTYIYLYYYLFYSYIFLRNNNVIKPMHILSRVTLFSGNSSMFYSNTIASCRASNVMLDSFLDRISILHLNSVTNNVSNNENSKDYIKTVPFFHGNSIVFLHSSTIIYHLVNSSLLTSFFNFSCPRVTVIYDTKKIHNIVCTWHALVTRNMLHRYEHTNLLRSNVIRTRLFAQSCTEHQIASDRIYRHKFNKSFITLNKKVRTFFSMSKRHYQHKWYSV